MEKVPANRSPEDFKSLPSSRKRREVKDDDLEVYIAAKFMGDTLPSSFNVGDGTTDDGYFNKPLTPSYYYSFFLRAYVKSKKVRLIVEAIPQQQWR